MPASAVISALARSLAAAEPVVDAIHARAVQTLGEPWRWLRPLATRYAEAFAGRPPARHRDVVRFLLEDREFQSALQKHRAQLRVAHWLPDPPAMRPAGPAAAWTLPALPTSGDLAAWLVLDAGDLEWFADLKSLGDKLANPKLQHYRYGLLPKRSGGVRLMESPKPRLKELQRRILHEIIDRVPVHPAVHGFVPRRSIVTFAAPHAGQHVLLRLDLQDFFPAFPAARVQALFRTLGYPEAVADRLGGICTNAAPKSAWRQRPLEISLRDWQDARILYTRPHLPQGAPSSPALANLMTYRLDCRLSGLARSAGAVYTRYADDLAFSGGLEFDRAVERFSAHAAAIALEEGFHVNHHKTRVMRRGVRQQLAGIVVNEKANLQRREVKLLEATLTNCLRHGPQSQNRGAHPDFRAHLEGRVGFVEMVNRARGLKLRELLQAIAWN